MRSKTRPGLAFQFSFEQMSQMAAGRLATLTGRQAGAMTLHDLIKLKPDEMASELKVMSGAGGGYLFCDRGVPFYVGISRDVCKRIAQQGRGGTQHDATVAYRVAKERAKEELAGARGEAAKASAFEEHFELAKRELCDMIVSAVEIDDAAARYLFELFAAVKLKTRGQNSFDGY